MMAAMMRCNSKVSPGMVTGKVTVKRHLGRIKARSDE